MNPAVKACLLLCALVPASVPAQEKPAAAEPSLTQLRPTGPVTVTADRAEWEKSGTMLYSGSVSMSSDTLSMKGDRLELRQKASGQYEALLTGGPARMDHAGDPNGPAETAQPVHAEAKSLFYDTANSTVQLQGAAHLIRGTDVINGETIRYDVAARRINAAGGEGGQVRIVIQPPPKAGKPPP